MIGTQGTNATATQACIEGMSAFGLAEDKDQGEEVISGLLQQAFINLLMPEAQLMRSICEAKANEVELPG